MITYISSTCSHLRSILLAVALLVIGAAALHAQPAPDAKARELGKSWKERAEDLLYNSRDYKSAIELYNKWLDASPRDNASWYNLACAYALSGDKVGAIDAWERAVDAGWADAEHARGDADLTSIKSDPRFEAALKKIEARKAMRGPRDHIRRFAEMRTVGTYIVALPPDYATSGKEYPICLILHGSGSSEVNHGALADSFGRAGIIYVAPRAPYPSIEVIQGGGSGWTAWSPERIDPNDPSYNAVADNYVEWIFNCVRDVQSNYRASKGKIFIYGHSQGAYFANLCALKYPGEIAAYLGHAGRMPAAPFYSTESVARLKEQGMRVTLVHGDEDNVVLPEESKKYAEALKNAGVSHTLKVVKGGHGFSKEIRAAVNAWIDAEVRAAGAASRGASK